MSINLVLDFKKPVKSWTKDIETTAMKQLENTASMPFIFKHVAVMPDVHAGFGSTVGTVVATKDAIMPACVGVDLGCGMSALRLPWLDVRRARDKSREIFDAIEAAIPTGMSGNSDAQADRALGILLGGRGWVDDCVTQLIRHNGGDRLQRAAHKIDRQLGTLGGGNHFIEICESVRGETWLMLHSGSRGVGNLIAQHHIDVAKNDMKRMFIELVDPDLAYFVTGRIEFASYIADMHLAQKFARLNRAVMVTIVVDELKKLFGVTEAVPLETIDCHHNFVEMENHFGQNVYVTRKGAVRARETDFGIIPGSMGARSFIVKGKGNADSFCSCSHGAGRTMSRREARRRFTVEDLRAATQGVVCRVEDGTLDEIPSSYKDIDQVMAEQSDLVEVIEELKQFVCVKGSEGGGKHQ